VNASQGDLEAHRGTSWQDRRLDSQAKHQPRHGDGGRWQGCEVAEGEAYRA